MGPFNQEPGTVQQVCVERGFGITNPYLREFGSTDTIMHINQANLYAMHIKYQISISKE